MSNAASDPSNRGAKDREPPYLKLAKYAAIGLEFPSTVIGGIVLGYLLDVYLDTSPWFAIALTLVAFSGACIRLVQWVRRFASEDNE